MHAIGAWPAVHRGISVLSVGWYVNLFCSIVRRSVLKRPLVFSALRVYALGRFWSLAVVVFILSMMPNIVKFVRIPQYQAVLPDHRAVPCSSRSCFVSGRGLHHASDRTPGPQSGLQDHPRTNHNPIGRHVSLLVF